MSENDGKEELNSLMSRFEYFYFGTRYFLVPFYVGILVALLMLMGKFLQTLFEAMPLVFAMGQKELILKVLDLVDMALVANLILMVAFVGYYQFIASFRMDLGKKNKPGWLTSVDYHGLKLKAMGSVALICSIELLRVFLNVQDFEEAQVIMRLAILLGIAIAGLMLAVMDRIAHDE